MTTVFKDMNADIKAFKVFEVRYNQLVLRPDITDIHSYNHQVFQLHHFIKAQDYKRNMQWYIENGIEEILILMRIIMHEHLESPIYGLSEQMFYRKYKISKDKLLFNKNQWLQQQVEEKENEKWKHLLKKNSN